MKRLLLLSLASLAAICAIAADKTLYLNTGGTGLWGADNATFAIWHWDANGNSSWSAMMTKVDGDLYKATIPATSTNVIFVRMMSGTTTPSWEAKWNQTEDLQYGSYDTFTITAWGSDKSVGNWSSSTGEGGTHYTSQAPQNCPDIILQAFYYDSYSTDGIGRVFGDTRWSTLVKQVPSLAESFDIIWLPPSAMSVGGTGYIPKQYSNQSSDWGTAAQLNTLIKSLHASGAKVMADIVVNHLGNNDSWCGFYQQDFGEYGSFQPQANWVTANDEMNYTDASGSCKGKGTVWDDGYGDGQNYDAARDLAHDKSEVREMCRAYLKWMHDKVGYDAWRYDFGKGFHGSHEDDYNRSSGAYFAVVEYWDGVSAIENILNDASWNMYAFDFPTKYKINTGIGDGNYPDLLCSGLICSHPNHAVTFIDNHDTFRRDHDGTLQDNGEFMGNNGSIGNYANRTVQAYAFILSMPGVPCVFYPHWYTFPSQIKAFCDARHRACVHSGSSCSDEAGDGYYKATITGTGGGAIKLFIGPNSNYGNTPSGYTKAYVGENCGVYYKQSSDYKERQPDIDPDIYDDYYLIGYIDNTDLTDALPQYRFSKAGELKTRFNTDAYVYFKNDASDTYYMTQHYIPAGTYTGLFQVSEYGNGIAEKMFAPKDKDLTYTLHSNGDDTFTLSYTISDITTGMEDLSSSPQGEDRGRLILRDGHIYLLRGDKTYTLIGQEVH